jgi:hypothetical protein
MFYNDGIVINWDCQTSQKIEWEDALISWWRLQKSWELGAMVICKKWEALMCKSKCIRRLERAWHFSSWKDISYREFSWSESSPKKESQVSLNGIPTHRKGSYLNKFQYFWQIYIDGNSAWVSAWFFCLNIMFRKQKQKICTFGICHFFCYSCFQFSSVSFLHNFENLNSLNI